MTLPPFATWQLKRGEFKNQALKDIPMKVLTELMASYDLKLEDRLIIREFVEGLIKPKPLVHINAREGI